MGQLVLIVGAARSGKSRFANKYAARLGKKQVTYIATAQALDEEMRRRVYKHRQDRPTAWKTLEAPFDLTRQVSPQRFPKDVLLIDCLTLYLSNIFLKDFSVFTADRDAGRLECRLLADIRLLAKRLASRKKPSLVVTNEVGAGIVPENRMARHYRDLVGKSNQMMAHAASEVHHIVSGIATRIK